MLVDSSPDVEVSVAMRVDRNGAGGAIEGLRNLDERSDSQWNLRSESRVLPSISHNPSRLRWIRLVGTNVRNRAAHWPRFLGLHAGEERYFEQSSHHESR